MKTIKEKTSRVEEMEDGQMEVESECVDIISEDGGKDVRVAEVTLSWSPKENQNEQA